MTDPAAARLRLLVRRLSISSRLRRALTHGTRGLFFGLLGALLIAAAAASISLRGPVLPACAAAAAGAAIGACVGLVQRIDVRRLLVQADRLLGSRELIGTGHEIAMTAARGTFADAVMEDAAVLLSGAGAKRALGPLRLRLAPFLPLMGVLVAAALVFPVDLRQLLVHRSDQEAVLGTIGEDLRGLGERLEEASRARDLGRRLALSQELAQLGRDMADHRIAPDDALDRISDLQNRVAREYQLQLQSSLLPGASLPDGRGSAAGSSGSGNQGSANAQAGIGDGSGESTTGDSNGDSKDLAGALERLRQAQDLLKSGQQSARRTPSTGQSPGSPGSPDKAAAGSGAGGKGSGKNGPGGRDPEGGGGRGEGAGADAGQPLPGGAPGTAPAPVKTGPPTDIARGARGNVQRAQGSPGEGDSTSFLVRALPEWTGARLPEDAVRRQYAQAAESALLRDEVPPKLKASVRDYFTNIGIPAGGAASTAGAGPSDRSGTSGPAGPSSGGQ